MAKIDLHVHSKYSEHPSEWFLQRIGAKESYTEPEFLYRSAKKRGMDLVTITDHNRIEGALRLKDRHPEEVIIGVESTTYFPENGCKIHILLYGIDERQFEKIQEIRSNIYELREYMRSENIAYSVAHATFSINKRLTPEQVEKLILLFDVFEGINGGRNYQSNTGCMDILQHLTPEHLLLLQDKYRIEPFDESSWRKSFTAGSDDHSGLFVGRTYTLTEGRTIQDVLSNIKHKKTSPMGRHNDYKSLAFTVYKIAYDFSRSQQEALTGSFASRLTENIFESKPLDLKYKLQRLLLKTQKKKDQNRIPGLLMELLDEIKKIKPDDLDERLELVYNKTADIADEYLRKVLYSLKKELSSGNIVNFIINLSSSIAGIFLSLPFFTAIKHMYHSRNLVQELYARLDIPSQNSNKKILWFTDTIDDLNGVSETLKELAWISFRNGNHIRIVTSLSSGRKVSELPPNVIYLPYFFNTELPGNGDINMYFPSVLRSLQIINIEEPGEIFISTPGPIGLLGLLFARLFNIRSTGIYHTDMTLEISKISRDATLTQLVENYSRWFYSMVDIIKVNTLGDMNILEKRGLNRKQMEVLPRGIDTHIFSFRPDAREKLKKTYGMEDGFNLLYAGRLSQDKSLDFLIQVFKELLRRNHPVNLIIAGTGPYMDKIKTMTRGMTRVHYFDRITRDQLPDIYSAGDILLFPSITDTFSVVVEAQACGLPAVVLNRGGPREIMRDGITGFEAREHDLEQWVEKIEAILRMKATHDGAYKKMREEARNHVIRNFDWETVIEDITGEELVS